MEKLLVGNSVYISDASLKEEHENEKTKTVNSYHKDNKYGKFNEEIAKEYEDQLIEVG